MSRTAALPALFALCATLAACSGLRADGTPAQSYTLRYQPAAAGAAPATAPALPAGESLPALQVLRPLAAPGLDADGIAVLREGRRLDAYAGARWSGPLPELVESLAVDALRARGRYRAIVGDAGVFASDQVLQLEISRCEAVYEGGGAPTVQVRLVASFGRPDDRRLLSTQLLEASVPAQANRLGDVVQAYEQALNAAFSQLVLP